MVLLVTLLAKRGRATNKKSIEGTGGLWQLSPDGKAYYKRSLVTPVGGVQPMIELGPSGKSVPVIPAYDDGSNMWFLDELVSWHFVHQTPVTLQRYTHTVHRDGDWSNCAADNLYPVVDAEWLDQNESRAWVELWADDERLASTVKAGEVARFGGRRGDTMPRDLRDCGELLRLPNWHALPVPPWIHDRRKAQQDNLKAS